VLGPLEREAFHATVAAAAAIATLAVLPALLIRDAGER
jgi:hypothetical protein